MTSPEEREDLGDPLRLISPDDYREGMAHRLMPSELVEAGQVRVRAKVFVDSDLFYEYHTPFLKLDYREGLGVELMLHMYPPESYMAPHRLGEDGVLRWAGGYARSLRINDERAAVGSVYLLRDEDSIDANLNLLPTEGKASEFADTEEATS